MKAGDRLKSAVCEAQIIVVRPPTREVDLRCGGAPLEPMNSTAARTEINPAFAGGTVLGKRYADEESGLEVLCTKSGAGSLTLNGTPLPQKDAKPLPSSD